MRFRTRKWSQESWSLHSYAADGNGPEDGWHILTILSLSPQWLFNEHVVEKHGLTWSNAKRFCFGNRRYRQEKDGKCLQNQHSCQKVLKWKEVSRLKHLTFTWPNWEIWKPQRAKLRSVTGKKRRLDLGWNQLLTALRNERSFSSK